MSFLAKAVNSPGFLAQFVQQQNERNRHAMEGNRNAIVKYQPVMNEGASINAQTVEVPRSHSSGSSTHFCPAICKCNFSCCWSSSSAAISEIQSSPLGKSSEIAHIQFSDISSLVGAQDLPPVSDMTMPEVSQLQEIVPVNNMDSNRSEMENGSFMDPTLDGNGIVPLRIDTFSPDPQSEWQSNLIDRVT
ncbi:PREDICTED: heat shock factor protein HSF8-like [Nicotiana attenuata]|uniref:heat shock factor protein HSF8-like n=1 Tax=Nicotiana attenuata TaxID=49451 RepID=UPI0009056F6D|nr:PREDICTED: heat shock factor protein HSF8-like [Nicotiana attenuata]